MAYDKAAFKLRGDYARLNFPNLKHTDAHHLHSSVDAKLEAICQSLENSKKSIAPPPVVAVESDVSCSTSTSSADSPVSEIESLDFSEVPWDETEDFVLKKYPSWEIDWDAILS